MAGERLDLVLRHALPSRKPADFDAYRAALRANLAEPGRFEAVQAMLRRSDAEIEARLPPVQAPSLVLMGTKDPDFPDPAAEARWVAEQLRGEARMIEGAGHYPQTEVPEGSDELQRDGDASFTFAEDVGRTVRTWLLRRALVLWCGPAREAAAIPSSGRGRLPGAQRPSHRHDLPQVVGAMVHCHQHLP